MRSKESSYSDRNQEKKNDVRPLLRKYHFSVPYGFDDPENISSALIFLDKIKGNIEGDLLRDLESLMFEWVKQGELYDATQLCERLGHPKEMLYTIAKEAAGDTFGNDYNEYLLITEYGTHEEINTTLQECPHVENTWFFQTEGKVASCIDDIRKSLRKIYPREVRADGLEFCNTHDLVDRYDAIVGIAHSGVAVPLVASALGHNNTGVVEYHRRWEAKRPRWMYTPSKEASRVLVCDNDASTGTTLSRVVPYVLNRIKAQVADVVFCGSMDPKGDVAIAKKISGVADAFYLPDMPVKDPYTRICEVRDAVKEMVNPFQK